MLVQHIFVVVVVHIYIFRSRYCSFIGGGVITWINVDRSTKILSLCNQKYYNVPSLYLFPWNPPWCSPPYSLINSIFFLNIYTILLMYLPTPGISPYIGGIICFPINQYVSSWGTPPVVAVLSPSAPTLLKGGTTPLSNFQIYISSLQYSIPQPNASSTELPLSFPSRPMSLSQ